MKKLSTTLALLLLLVLPCSMQVVGQGGGATPFPDHVTLSWTGDPAKTMTIAWRTDTTVTCGLVQYQAGAVLSGMAKQAKASAYDLATDLGEMRLFTATLTGLSSNTKYSYRVGDGSRWSDTHTFSTADPQARAFKFLIFGDSQSSLAGDVPYGAWRTTVHNAYRANPDARFMVNVGDLVDYGQRYEHWNAWFDAAAGVIDSIPVMAVPGNHESYGSRSTTKPAYWSAQLKLPQNGPEGLKNQVYSCDYGPVHFVVLDSQQFEQKQYGDILTPQREWLDADLASSKATWKIVFLHKPPYEIKPDRQNQDVKAAFCPILDRHHVDLVFNAHDHGISRTPAIKGDVIMEKPSEGTVYYVVGRSGEKTYPDLKRKPWNPFFYNPLDQPNYLVVEVNDKKVIIKTLKQDGNLLDTFVIDKEKDSMSDVSRDLAPAVKIALLPCGIYLQIPHGSKARILDQKARIECAPL